MKKKKYRIKAADSRRIRDLAQPLLAEIEKFEGKVIVEVNSKSGIDIIHWGIANEGRIRFLIDVE